jgi:hypothetical protein
VGFFEWWADLPVWLRYGTALFFLAISTVLWFPGSVLALGLGRRNRVTPHGWAVEG